MTQDFNVLIVGGTHGNELSGTTYVNRHLSDPQVAADLSAIYPNLNIDWVIANPFAMQMRTRFVEEDLNRQFTPDKLKAEQTHTLEHARALELNQLYGPKNAPKTDLVVDIHNTTSNMGPTLILLESDEWHCKLARFVKTKMPEAIILMEDEMPFSQHKYLCTIGKRGVMIEVGPQPQGVLRPKAYLETEQMCTLILEFCNRQDEISLTDIEAVEAFRLGREVMFPIDAAGQVAAMIHPDLQDQDFKALSHGMPMFRTFEGEIICYDGEDVIYPHFIGEAAYYHLGIAFATASRFEF